ncbi:hypothetical protein D3C87_2160350 [compost metagenome]
MPYQAAITELPMTTEGGVMSETAPSWLRITVALPEIMLESSLSAEMPISSRRVTSSIIMAPATASAVCLSMP